MRPALFLFSLLLLGLVISVSATKSYNNTNFGFGYGNGNYVYFSATRTFTDLNRTGDYLYFDGYGFDVDNSNATISNLFSNSFLELTTVGSNVVLKVNPTENGYNYEPKNIEQTGQGVMGYSWSGGILTITDTASASYKIDWTASPQNEEGGGSGVYDPTKIDAVLTTLPLYSNITVVNQDVMFVEGYLKTTTGYGVMGKQVRLESSWGFSNSTFTSNTTGYFRVGFQTPSQNGKYSFALKFLGDDIYNPCTLGLSLIVIGKLPSLPQPLNIPLVYIGLIILGIVLALAIGTWIEEQTKKK